MKMALGTIWVGLALLLALGAGTLAAADPTLDDFKLGDHVCGEKWDAAGLKGRTVLIYFWDVG
jgi:hypothetical protein